ncbi:MULTISPECIES: GNAT family N-acetyltransferase [Sphingomonas]|uniref:GNAT family N-acetyltransferase n=1 Tax=Sphingomonas TaxID=13687 RepID=UPI000DEFED88|nr:MULTISPECIES: GNAT family N-acetyltransferase [Sphingomonas]
MVEVVAETERLRLRTWGPGDREEFTRVTNTPAVMRWLGGVSDEATRNGAFERMDGFQRDHGHTFWIVERKDDGALLGFCGLKRVNAPGAEPLHGEFEVGWRLREDAWGAGYAKEAAIASLDLAFGRYCASRVLAMTVAGNRPSYGLMERLGMRRREDLDFVDHRFPSPSEINPAIVYSIDAADWPAARAAALA